jgi:hypothetical protein
MLPIDFNMDIGLLYNQANWDFIHINPKRFIIKCDDIDDIEFEYFNDNDGQDWWECAMTYKGEFFDEIGIEYESETEQINTNLGKLALIMFFNPPERLCI